MRAALTGGRPDRVPLGEFGLAPGLVAALLGREREEMPPGGPEGWREAERAVRLLGLDAVGVTAGAAGGSGDWPEQVAYWAGRDLFVWAVVDGPWQGLARAVGWAQALLMLSGRAGGGQAWEVEGLLLLQLDRALAEVGRALEAGADGVVLGEDLAHSGGPFLSPAAVEGSLAPLWREVVDYCSRARTLRGERPLVCFHSDGRVAPLLPVVTGAGFDVLHSLEPEAGMDAALLVRQWRGRLGLWGGLSLDLLVRGRPEQVAAEAQRLARAAADGGLVVGTCAGLVPEGVPPENLLAACRAVAAGGRDRNPTG